MPQISKLIKSREDWKDKAIQRGCEIREFRKTRKRHLETIAELKRTNRKLIKSADDKKKLLGSFPNNLELQVICQKSS